MKHFAYLAILSISVCGCTQQEGTLAGRSLPVESQLEDDDHDQAIAAVGPKEGHVLHVQTGDRDWDSACNDHLHFCVFENGKTDSLYIGTKYGLWMNGKFDVEINEKIVFSGSVKRLLYSGMIIDIGDAIPADFETDHACISAVKGQLK